MRIVMFTNVYLPKVGGVSYSVQAFARRLRDFGDQVIVVAPSYAEAIDDDVGVFRVPAWHDFLKDYSLPIPIPGELRQQLTKFRPQIFHAHHPFLLGATAHKMAATFNVPIVYTHHTRFDAYGAYFPSEHGMLQNFVVSLASRFANLCQAVVAPGSSVNQSLENEGVESPIHVIPTGVDIRRFQSGNAAAARRSWNIPDEAPVVGYVGRLASEKNLAFLSEALAGLLRKSPQAHALFVGGGEFEQPLRALLDRNGVEGRVHMPGTLSGQPLVDAYHAMDVFTFASKSETQGMVLTEAMAAGVPVVALRASGVEDVVVDGEQGRLLEREDADQFAAAILDILEADPPRREAYRQHCKAAAGQLSIEACGHRLQALYHDVVDDFSGWQLPAAEAGSAWDEIGRRLQDELVLLRNTSKAVRDAVVRFLFG